MHKWLLAFRILLSSDEDDRVLKLEAQRLDLFPNLSETSETGTTDDQNILGFIRAGKHVSRFSRHVLAADLLIFLKPHAPEKLVQIQE
jgi:hypothetical protein